jgi:hypothetical protein
MVSEVSICNSALAKLGAERIISLDDDNPRAIVMKEQYHKVRDSLLYSHPWNFAIVYSELAQLADQPEYDFDYKFGLPNDCLRVIDTDLPSGERWKVFGRDLYCNETSVSIRYLSNSVDVSDFSPAFIEALACKLASDVTFTIVQDAALKASLYKEYTQNLREARSFDAQESGGDRVYSDNWLNSRE